MRNASGRGRHLWSGRLLALLGIFLVAANLRTAVASLSPVTSLVTVDIPLGSLALGVLGMLPPVCFAVFGIFTPVFSRRLGLEGVLVLALFALFLGHLLRGVAADLGWLLAGSALTFAALGVANVLLPPLVKKYFPDRLGLMTSLFVTLVALSTVLPPLVAVPVAESAGWRVSMGKWGLLSLLAIVPWITMLVRNRTANLPSPVIDEADAGLLSRIWRSSIAWAIAVVFAMSAINAYAVFAWLPQLLIDRAGFSPAEAGLTLSLYAAMGIPCALIIPMLTVRMKNVGLLVYLGVFFFLAGDLGLLLAPQTFTWLWVACAGLGPLFFPLALTLINLRTRTHQGAVALSGFVQSVGYTLGALGPLAMALLHEITDAWTWPLLFLIVTALLVSLAGPVISRPHLLEDDLARIR